MALAAYRNLLRSTRIAFQGDIPTLLSARTAVRDNFNKNRTLPSSSPEFTEQIQYAQEVAKILRENLVQGRAVDGDGDRYKLRIHEHTERGDNDSIKTAGKKGKIDSLAGVKCCSI
ncbi:mitochondrial zinc maintenance protein 1 [Venturia nashicola]|uniref:Mitochondrial zinc maintenance protein 1, mitochondrial n=1 Tax=Venturia nashicola TaxID=86259 RepID=A0A4Z1PN52_9PEZI|nr:mitochondrial zinc maintenance protein 1 [Venturia nashicola]